MYIFGQKNELKEGIGFWQLFFMAFSGTFGAGLFVLISDGVKIAGYALPFTFLISGIISYFITHIYAELAVSLPQAGGGQVYLRNAFGDNPILFVVHWLTWLAEIAFTSLNAWGLGAYLSTLININPLVIATIALILLIILNLRGVEHIGKIELVIGVLMIIPIIGIILTSLNQFSVNSISWQQELNDVVRFKWLPAIPVIFMIFIGSEDIAAIAAEVKNKEKSLPKALFLTVISITVLSVIFTFLFLHSFNLNEIINSKQPLYLLLEDAGFLTRIIIIATPILATASSMFFGFLADTRTAYALAKAKELPHIFTKTNKFKTPWISILFCGIISWVLCLTKSASFIAQIATIGFLLECIAITFALIKLRKERPHLPRPYLIKNSKLLSWFIIIICAILLLFIKINSWLIAVAFAIMGLILHFLSYSTRKRLKIAAIGMVIFSILNLVIFSYIL